MAEKRDRSTEYFAKKFKGEFARAVSELVANACKPAGCVYATLSAEKGGLNTCALPRYSNQKIINNFANNGCDRVLTGEGRGRLDRNGNFKKNKYLF